MSQRHGRTYLAKAPSLLIVLLALCSFSSVSSISGSSKHKENASLRQREIDARVGDGENENESQHRELVDQINQKLQSTVVEETQYTVALGQVKAALTNLIASGVYSDVKVSRTDHSETLPVLTIVDDKDKLGVCEGDCSDNDDCEDGLECYQRDSDDDFVPGCSGEPYSSRDYCYVPPTQGPTPYRKPLMLMEKPDWSLDVLNTSLPVLLEVDDDMKDTRSDDLLGLCEGDCDDDEDCRGDLVCFDRSGSTPIPGCSTEGRSGKDYCVDPNTLGYLDECQGHCNSDKDCKSGLKCHDTKGNGFVPGCAGEPDGRDYCINPASPGPDSNLEKFRLRLHWEKSYDSHSGSFCMDCSSSCDVERCSSSRDDFRFINMDGERTQIQKVGSSRCLVQSSSSIRLSTCDETDPCQFFTSGKGSFYGYLFELVTCKGKCVTQDHYPRSGEDLFGGTCSTARRHFTNYWYKY